MKRLAWFIGFFLLFFAGDRLASFFLGKTVAKSNFRYSRMYEGGGEADVLLLGNSRGLTLYQPEIERITGKKTMNLSYNGLPMYLGNALAKDYIEKYNPKTIIIEVTTCDRDNNALLSAYMPYLKYSPRIAQLVKDSLPETYYAAQLSHLFRYNGEVFQRSLNYLNYSDETWIPDRVINKELIENVDQDTFKISLQPQLLDALADLTSFAKSKNVEVKLVVGPYVPAWNAHLRGIPQLIAAAKSATGLPVYDFSNVIKDPKLFSDMMHPNKEGSKHYVSMMAADGMFE